VARNAAFRREVGLGGGHAGQGGRGVVGHDLQGTPETIFTLYYMHHLYSLLQSLLCPRQQYLQPSLLGST
jgi:hypothetical protein